MVTSYYCMAWSSYPEAAYEEVFSVVAQVLAWLQGSQAVDSVAKSSISAARSKIGYAPLKSIHETACVALAQPDAQLSTLVDPDQAPALELAALYHERREVEAVFDKLKIHPVQRRRTLRSKTPDGVRQEFHGWVLAHYAVLLAHASSSQRSPTAATTIIVHRPCGQPANCFAYRSSLNLPKS